MGKNTNQQEVFNDLQDRYLRADTDVRNAASKKAAIMDEAEKAGFSKKVFKESAKMEKMDGPQRSAYLSTLILYARYSGHDEQIELFADLSTEQMEMAAHDASGGSDDDDGEDDDQDQFDIEEAVAEAEADGELSAEDQQRLADAEEFDADFDEAEG